ncbi:MAG: hypothetical protein WDO71_03480 [Bacteroidota bacterium]
MSADKKIPVRLVCSDGTIAWQRWHGFAFILYATLCSTTRAPYPISYQLWAYILTGCTPQAGSYFTHWAGTYHSLYKKSRLAEFTLTFVCSIIGCILFFILFAWNDPHGILSSRYITFVSLVGIHFTLTFWEDGFYCEK